MGKLALVVFLLSAFHPGGDIDMEGNTIYLDRMDGSEVVVIEVKDDGPAEITYLESDAEDDTDPEEEASAESE